MAKAADIITPPVGDEISPHPNSRMSQLDLLRGFIMVVMALDHVAFFVARRHPSEMWSVPLPDYPSFISFFTRAITHLSAPGFFLIICRTRFGNHLQMI